MEEDLKSIDDLPPGLREEEYLREKEDQKEKFSLFDEPKEDPYAFSYQVDSNSYKAEEASSLHLSGVI